ncbi:MAG: threonine synthase [Candidatus Limnocylindria bacterium]
MNLEATYDLEAARAAAGGTLAQLWDDAQPGIWRYRALLPVRAARAVSLEEGDTPLHRLERLGGELGLAALYAKDETRAATWSYKDRLASVLVTKALELGAEGVVLSSTGNHGAAVAAYAARAGLPCVVLTLASVPATMKAQMQAYGAMVVALERSTDRLLLVRKCVEALGWFPASGYLWPPVGTPAFGMEGYKSIAYEILERLGSPPDWIVVPTSYADGLYGIWKGFRELREMGLIDRAPRMVAAEVFGPLAETLASGADLPTQVPTSPSVSFSIATPIGTYQGLAALRESEGMAAAVPDDAAMTTQLRLASLEGLYVEASSATGIAAAATLRREARIAEDDRVVVVLTSTGLKDPAATAARLPEVPLVPPEVESLRDTLRSAYGFRM